MAQEYSITEIEDMAYSFFNAAPQHAPGTDGNFPTKQISSIEAISRNSTNYMYIANAEDSAGWFLNRHSTNTYNVMGMEVK